MDYRRRPDEFDVDKLLESVGPTLRKLEQRFGGGFRGLLIPLAAILPALWLASGIYIVGPDERGVVRQFGAFTAITDPGPRWHIPWPVQQVDKVNVTQVRRMELGFRSTERGATLVREESHMITGDENIVDVQMIIQYRVTEPEKYLFRVWDPEGPPDRRTLRDATEAALRLVVGQRAIDDVLTVEKTAVQEDTKVFLQELMASYGTGIRIDQVQLQDVQPPQQVQAAFKDVVSAKEDKERLINQAKGYEQDIIPKARGEAERLIREAEGYKEQRVRQAEGDAARFLAVLEAYTKAKDVTRQRLYLETIEEILPGMKKFIVSPEAGGNLLQFLPLQEAGFPGTVVAPAPPTAPQSASTSGR
ncbi:MAG: FtsH protease activity modulator HflK [Chloroflexi bacterium]|nr:FtsH protease activity modulator HflK [Chloroflexota bacterium]